jgi:hypothetical protein
MTMIANGRQIHFMPTLVATTSTILDHNFSAKTECFTKGRSGLFILKALAKAFTARKSVFVILFKKAQKRA